jgi:undecaprenyl diphosphate synthase
MSLLNEFVDENLESMQEQGVRLRTIGEFDKLPPNNRAKLNKAMSLTKENKTCTLTLALSYGGRKEIVDAVKNIAEDLKDAKIKSSQITEKTIAKYLYAPDIPDPDLMIRTSGEKRISNFLLWQLSYSEFYFTETLWPDFNAEELNNAVDYYYKRERRFGGR